MKWFAPFKKNVAYHWVASLAFVAFLLFLLNASLFYPGYMSPDSLSQLGQALGTQPVTDWHPPVMVFAWKILYFFTHYVSSMLVFQIALLWASLLLFSVTIFKATRSYRFSLLPLLIGLLPFTLNISGVIWKDVQMAHALLFAVALTLYVSTVKIHQYARWGIFAGVAVLFVYATLLRYNVILAVMPIGYLFVSQFDQTDFKRIRYIVAVGLIGLLGIGYLIVNITLKPQAAHPASAIMLDDVMHIASNDELQQIDMSRPLKTALALHAKQM